MIIVTPIKLKAEKILRNYKMKKSYCRRNAIFTNIDGKLIDHSVITFSFETKIIP